MVVGNVGTYNSPCVVLGQNRYWWKFILSSVITPFVLAFLVLLARFFVWIHYRALRRTHLDTETNLGFIHSMRKIHKEIEVPWMNAIRDAADLVVSPRYTSGHVLIVAAFVISMCSLFLYYNTVSYYISDVEMCQPWLNNVGQQVDFAFNMFFLVYFILRFLAAADKIKMIFSLYSIVDYFTVPPAFVGLALDRDWVGLKFLRVIYLRQLARILADMDIIVSTAHIKLLQLGLSWIALLLAAGGFFHLVENSGDPFISTFDGQRINYWNFCYFAFGTMATIGSADTNVKTVLGKLGNVVLMLIVLAVIGLAIPDIVNMLGAKRKYSGEHRRILNEKHIVVCGDVSFGTIYGLFQEFFHPDRNVHGIKIVCLGLPEPGLEYARFIKKNTYKLGYLQGSFLVAEDLYRARLHEADACVIMADKGTPNANAEDSNNIMCVVAIKNFNPQLRVIVQLLQYRSKTYLTSIPNWNPAIGDDVICLPEIKMGLLAQSCASPGFSTLMANIFAARSAEPKSSWPEWLQNYCTGAGIEMYTERLSDSLANCGFLELVETCYAKLNLIVFAVSEGPTNGEFFSQSFQLNPRTTYKIKVGSYAACFADSAKDASRMSIYCKHCHDDLSDPGQIKVCQCGDAGDSADRNRRGSKDSNRDRKRFTSIPAIHDGLNELRNRKSPSVHSATNSTAHLVNHQVSDNGGSYRMGRVNSGYNGDDDAKFDEEDERDEHIGRIFSSFEKKILYYMRYFGSPANWARRGLAEPLRDQYGDILDLSDGPRYDSTGLFWWCPPRPYEEVLLDRFQASQRSFNKHVVLIIFANENSSVIGLNNFVLPLRSSSSTYEELRDIVILGDPRFLNLEWPCLNNFPKITMVKVFGLSRADLRSVNIDRCEMCLLLSATAPKEAQGMLLTDKDAILTSLTIKAMNFGVQEDLFSARPIAGRGGPVPLTISVRNEDAAATVAHQKLRMLSESSSHKKNTTVVRGYAIPLLTELVNDENIQFVDQDDFDIEDFFMAEPFACGNAFATSVLQSLLVSTYFNPFTLAILRALIFGGVTPEFEQILSEGAGLIGGPNLSQRYPYAKRCRLSQLSVQDVRFVQFSTGPFGSLFLDAIRNHNMLCLGLSRRIQKTGNNARSKRRYVITAPAKDFLLEADDKIFVIERIRSTLSW